MLARMFIFPKKSFINSQSLVLKKLNHTLNTSEKCIFIRERDIIPVRIKSMSPAADFLIEKHIEKLDGDDEINHSIFRKKLEEEYKAYLNMSCTDLYKQDISTHWDPLKHFAIQNRKPLPLFPLSKAASEELNDIPSIIKKINYADKWSARRQDPYQSGPNSYGLLTMPIKLPQSDEVILPSNLLQISGIKEIVTHVPRPL